MLSTPNIRADERVPDRQMAAKQQMNKKLFRVFIFLLSLEDF
jgi:hypothetical protein